MLTPTEVSKYSPIEREILVAIIRSLLVKLFIQPSMGTYKIKFYRLGNDVGPHEDFWDTIGRIMKASGWQVNMVTPPENWNSHEPVTIDIKPVPGS